MMLVHLQDVHVLLDFFRDHVESSNKGVSNLLDKIDYYNEEEKILEEEPDHNETACPDNVYGGQGDCICPCNCGARHH